MEGLEISVVSFSEAWASAETRRLDPEYFQKQHLADEALVKLRPHDFQSFAALGLTVDGSAFYPAIESHYETGSLPFLRVADVDTVIDFQKCTRIPAELCDRYPTLSRVHPGDIVFTKGGSVARIGLVTEEAAASRDLIFINSSQLPTTERVFLYVYAQTGFFNRMLLRSSSQTAQPHLTITLVRNLPLFRAGKGLKDKCVEVVERAFSTRDTFIRLTKAAEASLTAAIGLADWRPPEPLTYARRASEVFAADRIDAEYFHPAKQGYLARLRAMPGKPLGEHYAAIREMFEPKKARPGESVRNFDLNDALDPVLDDSREPMSASEVGSTKKRFQAGDVVTSRLRAYLNETALVRTSHGVPAVGSSEFIVLRAIEGRNPKLSRATLLTFLRSRPVQTILHWSQDGSHHPRYSDEDLLSIPVPDAVCAAAPKVEKLFDEILTARAQATTLLAQAKRAVEIDIEESEAAALKYLKEI